MNTSLTRILLATDGSRAAALAGRTAADISEKFGAELHVLHVWTELPSPAYPDMSWDDYPRLAREEAAELLRRQAWNARSAGANVLGEHVRGGQPAEEITVLAKRLGVDLVVVGSRGAGRMKRLITGSVSEDVVRRACCPVLVVRGGEGAWPANRIVVGDDGSRSAERAGELAAELAAPFGTEVVLVRAYENPPEPVGGWSARDRNELDEAIRRNREMLEERAERLRALTRDRPGTRLVESGATLAILSVARREEGEATLIALGNRDLSATRRALLGSVSRRVLRAAEGPVLIVPPETASVRRSPEVRGGLRTSNLVFRQEARNTAGEG